MHLTMKVYLIVGLCLCALAAFSDGVTVKVGDFSFPLEEVKKLKDLQAAKPIRNPRVRRNLPVVPVCGNPKLPVEFRPLCASPKAPELFQELGAIAQEAEICEICANVACSGC